MDLNESPLARLMTLFHVDAGNGLFFSFGGRSRKARNSLQEEMYGRLRPSEPPAFHGARTLRTPYGGNALT